MKMYFLVCYLMVILWVCYGYPIVLTANYPIIPYRIPRVFKQIIYQKHPFFCVCAIFFVSLQRIQELYAKVCKRNSSAEVLR